jgi:hypothetical protein
LVILIFKATIKILKPELLSPPQDTPQRAPCEKTF